MKIAIDLNDVIRDYSDNYLNVYVTNYNHEFDLDDFEFWTNDFSSLFPFKNQRAYENFTYVDYAYELYGKCDVCTRNLSVELNTWMNELKELDIDENIHVMITSPMEHGDALNYSYFFISKLGCQFREIYFPIDSSTIWDRCDVLITANPKLLDSKPEGKLTVKIEKEYNKDSNANYTFKTLSKFIKEKDNYIKIFENGNQEK